MASIKNYGDLSKEQLDDLESQLRRKGFAKVPTGTKLSRGQYTTSSYSGSASDFGSEKKYNIEYAE